MKGLAAGLIFVNAATVCAVLAGLAGGGLGPVSATFSLVIALLFAFATWLSTSDPGPGSGDSESRRSRRIWLGIVGAIFAMFAFRSFCWLFFIDADDWKIQSPNNLGDLSLHITYIRTFMNGVPLWPDNPIYIASKIRYPAGIDLFNALLCLVRLDLAQSLVWVGLLGSVATFYALWRWGRTFGIAGFLFNGGTVGFVFLNKLIFDHVVSFQDYQGGNDVAWKSIPLSMFVTQRGWLYAIPAGLLLLWNWREIFARTGEGVAEPGGDSTVEVPNKRLSFAAELALYSSMPLFHVHTFLALSAVLVIFFIGGDRMVRRHVALLIGGAVLPATFFVWLVSDNFRAHSMITWMPGWVLNDHAMSRGSVFGFCFANFGILLPLILILIGCSAWRAWRSGSIKLELLGFLALVTVVLCLWRVWDTGFQFWTIIFLVLGFVSLGWYLSRAWDTAYYSDRPVSVETAFLIAALWIIAAGMLFKFAPWEWDNLKLMVWGYFILLPFLWDKLVRHWSLPVRTGICIALFGSGFVSLFGGLAAGAEGFGLITRSELDGVGVGVSILPLNARFASYPTYNHPLLLQGRKVVMGYPGHLWTQGFDDYGKVEAALRNVMNGGPNWRQTARALGVRYLFWGPEEKTNYPSSTRAWEAIAPIVSAGDWGTIYDLEALEPNAPRSLGTKTP